MQKSLIRIHLPAALLACALLAHAARGEVAGDIPASLKAWKYPDYSQRYYLKVEAPGEAGKADLHNESVMFAAATLPLKIAGEGAAARVERLVLVGEDGAVQPISTRPIAGSSEVEVVFQSYPGQRRFCLYAGASKPPAALSPTTLRPIPLMVHLRGMTAGPAFYPAPGTALTLERFINMERETMGNPLPPPKTLSNPDPHPELQPNIDDAECPYTGIFVNIFEQFQPGGLFNPPQYAALYEGFLRCPVAGKYTFALDTPGVGHLVIDGLKVLSLEQPDENREPFARKETVQLSEGVHRVVVHYAEANADPNKTNADTRRFGLRLHWQPPFSRGLACIPPLAFVKYLPAVTAGFETNSAETPFVHIETLGHVRVAAQKGDAAAREFVLICARGTGAGRVLVSAPGMSPVASDAKERSVCTWVPAGPPVEVSIEGVAGSKRAVTWPTLKTGVKEFMEREVMDLEAELLIKSAPEFLYPNETGHIHFEALLSPKPVIIPKPRFDIKDQLGWELMPPPAHPYGEFTVVFEQDGRQLQAFDATPSPKRGGAPGDDGGRKKVRASFPAELKTATASSQLTLRLIVDGIECQQERFRMLFAPAANWPGRISLSAGDLEFIPNGTAAEPEHVVMLVPHEDESAHNRFKLVGAITSSISPSEILFIGDPLVEGLDKQKAGSNLIGLSALLAKSRPKLKWTALDVPGPHRYPPLLGMLVELDQLSAKTANVLPKLAVVNLGSGDVARQTPLHVFERALDTLMARLSAGGVEVVIVVGVIPEPWREKQCEPYQERVNSVVRQHHARGIDLFREWTKESDWPKRFTPNGESSAVTGPLPNAATLDEIVRQILSRF